MRESHFKSGLNGRHAIDIIRFAPPHFKQELTFTETYPGLIPTKPEVERVREIATKQEKEKRGSRVTITYLDARNEPDNDRNAPISFSAKPVGVDENGFGIYPKIKTGRKGRYDWEELG